MAKRFAAMLLATIFIAGLSGCAHDPFACCDRRASLADWFDMYGPLGCSCKNGCPRNSSCNGNCNCR
jgi:hypothetical protein